MRSLVLFLPLAACATTDLISDSVRPKQERRAAPSAVSFTLYAQADDDERLRIHLATVSVTSDRNDWWNLLIDVVWALRASKEVHEWFLECFGSDPFTDGEYHHIHAPKKDWWCDIWDSNSAELKAYTSGFSQETVLCRGSNFDHPVVGSPGTQRKEIAATIMHELAHQLAPIKTNDSLSYLGAGGAISKCSAKDAERVGREAVRW